MTQRLTSLTVPITIEAMRQTIRIAIASFQRPGIGRNYTGSASSDERPRRIATPASMPPTRKTPELAMK